MFVIPDILCAAGGVTVSAFESTQNRQGFYWDELEVGNQLEKCMKRAFHEVHELAKRQKLDLRTAAYIVAISRVGNVTRMRGMYA